MIKWRKTVIKWPGFPAMVIQIVLIKFKVCTISVKVPLQIKVPMSNKNNQIQQDVSPQHRTHAKELLEVYASRVFQYFKYFWRENEITHQLTRRQKWGPLPELSFIFFLLTGRTFHSVSPTPIWMQGLSLFLRSKFKWHEGGGGLKNAPLNISFL